MLRFIYVLIRNLHRAWMIPQAGYYAVRERKYSEEFRYQYDLKMIRQMMKTARISTSVYGRDNLPATGGYVMFPNHQGKYDALGIMYGHPLPCSVVMDDARSHMPLVSQFIDLVKGNLMDDPGCTISVRQPGSSMRFPRRPHRDASSLFFRQEAISTATVTTWIRLNRVRLRVP